MNQAVMTIASIMVGVGLALLLEGLFPALMGWPLLMTIFGGVASGATYYGFYRIVA